LVKLFAIDLDASQIAAVTVLDRNTVNLYLMAIRQKIAQVCQRGTPISGEMKIDES
jgi:transposase